MTKTEFHILLLLYASYADLEFSEQEKLKIIDTHGQSAFEKINNLFDTIGEYTKLDTICELRKVFYPGQKGKNDILNMLKDHFLADGDYSKLEKSQYNFLKKIL